jgi:predicted helicase
MNEYLQSITQKYKDPQTSEMGYRTDFENFLEILFPKDQKYHIHHDAKAVGGNKPDFVVLKNQVPVLYIENKDIGIDLDKIEKSNQIDRYFGYDNLILTDQVEFRFYRNGQKYGEPIKIATYNKSDRIISQIPENFSLLEKTILDFTHSYKEPIKRGKHLAQIMGGKAQRIRDNVREMLISTSEKYTDLLNIKNVVTENLVADLDDEKFADMYAQTLVYGLFAARYNDKSPDTFSRGEARDLVPKTNPFLHSFFDHIAGASFPERLRFIVDELCEVFTHADVHKILHDFYGKEKDNKDPIIHFYEDFLKEYDAKKKMEMGVFYTPRPVVQFIVRAVDEILKKDFGLAKGLADTSKVKVKKQEIYQATKNTKTEQAKDGKLIDVEKEYHKVQVLDIATGTGTFLNEVVEHVYKSFAGQEGRWEAYVKENLLPRLHGFELMMASYTIAHLKLGMTLVDSGVTNLNQRLGIYLTNTLEEPKGHENQGTLFGFMDAIAEESKNASRIKTEYPIMCVIGNPPYSGESMNKEYTDNSVYKVEPGGKEKLKERNPKWINDDYVKFIRFAESLIEKNGEGVIGMITAHGYIDNPTFRGMRWHLRKTFDKIYIVDLHGNSNKKETTPDGSKDENVFDIKTGVSIILGVKNNLKKEDELAQVFKLDLFGLRKDKFAQLDESSIENSQWIELPQDSELWVLEGKGKKEYMEGFSISQIFPINSVGVVTSKDQILISDDRKNLLKKVSEFYDIETEESFVQKISYRPFDNKFIYFDSKLLERSREKVMQNFLHNENIGLVFRRAVHKHSYGLTFIINLIIRADNYGDFSSLPQIAPLYLYSNPNEKTPNLNTEIWNKINEIVGETTPENILDYIYAVLHSPAYREKYKEFLKTDFPRVPYPQDKDTFWKLVTLGTQLRELHLMTSPESQEVTTTYPEAGTDEVEKIRFEKQLTAHEKILGQKINLKRSDVGDVWINNDQYFGNVPEVAWNFYIGGYQPAQKYLKDRKGRKLSNDEIEHYQRIITVLNKTSEVMREIDEIWKKK